MFSLQEPCKEDRLKHQMNGNLLSFVLRICPITSGHQPRRIFEQNCGLFAACACTPSTQAGFSAASLYFWSLHPTLLLVSGAVPVHTQTRYINIKHSQCDLYKTGWRSSLNKVPLCIYIATSLNPRGHPSFLLLQSNVSHLNHICTLFCE